MTNTIISIKNLYKIFGDNPKNMMQYLLEGITKPDLLDQHNHVLGLNNINLDINSKHIHVIICLLYTSPSPRDATLSRMPSSA